MNGVGDDHEAQLEEDAYPEDGPLYSGTHSLRRIRNTSAPKMPSVSLCYTTILIPCLYVYSVGKYFDEDRERELGINLNLKNLARENNNSLSF